MLRYYGSKWRLAPWVLSHFPPHTCYVEPFGGSAAVLLRKQPAKHEVYNDLDGGVVNFFQVLQSQPEKLVRAIETTPYSREVYDLAAARVTQGECTSSAVLDALDWYIVSWQGWGAAGGRAQKTGWRMAKTGSASGVGLWCDLSPVVQAAARMRSVQIECDDYLKVLARFDTPATLHFLDPPYVQATRCKRWRSDGYRCEFTDDDHAQLLDELTTLEGMVILAGYASDQYAGALDGWARVETSARGQRSKSHTEVLWLNPAAMAAGRQQELF